MGEEGFACCGRHSLEPRWLRKHPGILSGDAWRPPGHCARPSGAPWDQQIRTTTRPCLIQTGASCWYGLPGPSKHPSKSQKLPQVSPHGLRWKLFAHPGRQVGGGIGGGSGVGRSRVLRFWGGLDAGRRSSRGVGGGSVRTLPKCMNYQLRRGGSFSSRERSAHFYNTKSDPRGP